MKKNCVIYIRVSTDEQADKGYSLRHQEERLRQFCLFKDYNIVALFKEDYSAKDFNRPEFIKLLEFVKKRKNNVNLLLFTKWDRFSRNAGDAYGMINTLNRLGIEPQAIEQPLDLSVPENKMMLAFYLAAPEVENDRRSINVIQGMRKARKEGRYLGVAPKGYINKRDEGGSPIIVPDKDAKFIKKGFQLMKSGLYQIEEVRRQLVEEGFECSKSSFPLMLRNCTYAGLIYIPPYKNEQEQYVKGIHDPLISEDIFWEVQDILKGRRRKIPNKNRDREQLPLRRVLTCSRCGNPLTGSGSKGKMGVIYYYYHCQKGCKERFRAELANNAFIQFLNKYSIKEEVVHLFKKELENKLKKDNLNVGKQMYHIEKEISEHNGRIEKALQMMLDGDIAPDEYKTVKLNYEKKIEKLIRKKSTLMISDHKMQDYIDFAFELVTNLSKFYENACLEAKQKFVSSIFPEKVIFEEKKYRTPKVHNAISLIGKEVRSLKRKKKRSAGKNIPLTKNVPGAGIEPAPPLRATGF